MAPTEQEMSRRKALQLAKAAGVAGLLAAVLPSRVEAQTPENGIVQANSIKYPLGRRWRQVTLNTATVKNVALMMAGYQYDFGLMERVDDWLSQNRLEIELEPADEPSGVLGTFASPEASESGHASIMLSFQHAKEMFVSQQGYRYSTNTLVHELLHFVEWLKDPKEYQAKLKRQRQYVVEELALSAGKGIGTGLITYATTRLVLRKLPLAMGSCLTAAALVTKNEFSKLSQEITSQPLLHGDRYDGLAEFLDRHPFIRDAAIDSWMFSPPPAKGQSIFTPWEDTYSNGAPTAP